MTKVLVIGGYGTFGGRLVELLSDEPRLTLVVAGRDLRAARRFAKRFRKAKAKVEFARIDRSAPEADIAVIRPDVVVDASGPFQHYGGDPYRCVEAALQAGASWLDLSDSAEFTKGIVCLDELAREKGLYALSGVSSFPVLTSAVAERISVGMMRVNAIEAGIAPSPHARVGSNVIRAIASYAGQRIPRRVGGRDGYGIGMVDSRHLPVNVPGAVPLPRTRFALVEVPDLTVLAEQFPDAKDVWVGAGPKPALLHRMLWLAGHAVRMRMLSSLSFMVPVMDFAVNVVRWGEHRGGMTVRLHGEDRDGPVVRAWGLIAEGDAGPMIPSMACELIVRKHLDGESPRPGARTGAGALSLDDYEAAFAKRGIVHGLRMERRKPDELLYRRVMGEAFDRLARPLRMQHGKSPRPSRGIARVRPASNPFAGMVARLFGFPQDDGAVAVQVDVIATKGGEKWVRTYGDRRFASHLSAGTGRFDGLIVERFGPFCFGMALVERDGRIEMPLRCWSFLGLPMPRFLMPKAVAREHAADGRFNFEVEIALPLLGRMVRYEGWIEHVSLAEAA